VYSAVVLVDGDLRGLEALPAPDPATLLERLVREPTAGIPAGASNVCVRTSRLREAGAFDDRVNHLTDWDLWLRLAERGAPAACPETHVGYVRHAGSMLLTLPESLLAEADYLFAKHAQVASERGLAFDRVGFIRWVASGHRRAGRRAKAARLFMRSGIEDRSPGNLVRAVAVLFGERVWRRLSPRSYEQGAEAPAWLAAYRPASP
jgi:hypothetical protein